MIISHGSESSSVMRDARNDALIVRCIIANQNLFSIITISQPSTNAITKFLTFISFLQVNSNDISDWKNVDKLQANKKLATIYLEYNPIAKDIQYRKKVKLTLPWLQKIDATLCR